MDNQNPKELLDKYLSGNCTPQERVLVERFYLLESRKRVLPEEFSDITVKDEIWDNLSLQLGKKQKPRFFYYSTIAAAIVLIILGPIMYFFFQDKKLVSSAQVKPLVQDIAPAVGNAVLTLDDGNQVQVSQVKNGVIAFQQGTKIEKTADGNLIYHSNVNSLNIGSPSFNSLSTSRGGKADVILEDGTRVWLNAASNLIFPTHFKGRERQVKLTGEAYFEVAKNKEMPFKVISGKQVIQVLGTHFNVNSYQDEGNIRTTLLEGSVKVSYNDGMASAVLSYSVVTLKPGQQSVFDKVLRVLPADITETMAWRDNRFTFHSQPLESIMRQISRWYDVDIHYKGNVSQKRFTGSISRYSKVSKVLSMLELTNLVHFKIEEGRITAMP